MASGTGGTTGRGRQRAGRPYRKRKPLPALLFIGVLGVAAVIVWINAVRTATDVSEAITCDPRPHPPAGTTFTPLPYDALVGTSPVPPSRVDLTVLNANGTRGEASMTTMALRQLGFDRITDPANDEVYTNGAVADCHGQIRFGPGGERAARTVQLVDPCLELVRDNREDPSIDLAVGTNFNDVRPSDAAIEILDRLKSWAKDRAEGGGEQSPGEGAADGPVLDDDLLEETVPERC
ncbi:hypothetical protein B1813_05680 [Saccharomonospora piscinae]|uniref:LytR/CpsA/Psr regulator C-terminal domain-containing protein n=1 Tax=Saccharomonospora piscinae TaxID=687388 RepID=A0A1V9AAL6_SACPI|nr:envelope integrity protein Cei [Saccharomonospora piscinae]OQO94162.1 hypothetical protein B1813_05680 [Saccharomonospora piscinae]TLW95394.1 LytR family transcriptional regulator [Saccharomonospora piscinae]